MATASTTTVETAPPVEQMMEEISAGTETMRLEQRLECLKDADKKIGELMNIVTEICSSLDKEKPMSKAKMEESYKRYEQKLDEIQKTIGEQLTYMEQVCVGAEHQGSNFHSKQMAEMGAKRLQSLHAHLADIREQCLIRDEEEKQEVQGNDGAAKDEEEQMETEETA